MAPSAVSLEDLPLEIRSMILVSLPDIKSLLNLIAASPYMLGLYRSSRDHFFISVVRNEIGRSLIIQAAFLTGILVPTPTRDDFSSDQCIEYIDTDDAKMLLHEEKLTRSIVQACVEDELELKVELTQTEWLRLRRGMYNLRVSARISEDYDTEELECFPESLLRHTLPEVLELLYILHCLRNRYAKFIKSLEDTILDDMLHHAFSPNFDLDYALFAKDSELAHYNWNRNAPFDSDIDAMYKACQVPARWNRKWKANPLHEMEYPIALWFLERSIPTDDDFHCSEGNGCLWLERFKCCGYNYQNAIPLGFMIWDTKRLESFSWAHNPPPPASIKANWRRTAKAYVSVQERFEEAWIEGCKNGEKLNTFIDELMKRENNIE